MRTGTEVGAEVAEAGAEMMDATETAAEAALRQRPWRRPRWPQRRNQLASGRRAPLRSWLARSGGRGRSAALRAACSGTGYPVRCPDAVREADPPVSLLSDPRVEEWLGSLSPEEVAASLSPEEVAAFLEAADEGPSSLEIG